MLVGARRRPLSLAVSVLVLAAGFVLRLTTDDPNSEVLGLYLLPICLMALAMGLVVPRRSWRWGVTPFAGQFAWLLLSQGVGNLLPLGIIAFAVMSLPAVLAAKVGAYFGKNKFDASDS